MFKKLTSLFQPASLPPIYIVSGLPRSGTSLMMQILVAGGMEAMLDHNRTADEDNPNGYYEFERVKNMQDGDVEWLDQAHGKVVKVISALLPSLPPHKQYRIVFVRRAMPEVLMSQKKMLRNRGEDPNRITDEEMGILLQKHLQNINSWVASQPNVKYIDVDYNALINKPTPIIVDLNRFFDNRLDTTRMKDVVDPSLYRHRVGN